MHEPHTPKRVMFPNHQTILNLKAPTLNHSCTPNTQALLDPNRHPNPEVYILQTKALECTALQIVLDPFESRASQSDTEDTTATIRVAGWGVK